jgi:hypothetical protein
MNIKNRIKKLELTYTNSAACYCGKTFIDLCYGISSYSDLTYCLNCRQQYEFWKGLVCEAQKSENLTDEI